MSRNPWLPYRKPSAGARLRLFCFHYAGGGASVFLPWRDKLPANIELCAVQLPGRESRFGETAFDRMGPLAEATLAGLGDELAEGPFAIFGHSMGAKLGYELTRALRSRGGPRPEYLFVSGARAPHIPHTGDTVHHLLPDDRLVQELRSYGASSEEALNNAELMSLLLPTIRADFAVSETYLPEGDGAIDVDLAVLGGTGDPYVSVEQLQAWSQYARAGFSRHLFPGHHFYLNEHATSVLAVLLGRLRDFVA